MSLPISPLNNFHKKIIEIRGVKGKSHVSNRKVICLEIEIDPFWAKKWVLLRYLSYKKSLLRPWEDWRSRMGILRSFSTDYLFFLELFLHKWWIIIKINLKNSIRLKGHPKIIFKWRFSVFCNPISHTNRQFWLRFC